MQMPTRNPLRASGVTMRVGRRVVLFFEGLQVKATEILVKLTLFFWYKTVIVHWVLGFAASYDHA